MPRGFPTACAALLLVALQGCSLENPTTQTQSKSAAAATEAKPRFSVVEASIADMQAAMAAGRTTSREIVSQYLARIQRYEPKLRATLAVKLEALAIAEERDRERAEGKVRGPLHGIPVALKDNIHTTDMPTIGGALAFRDYTPPYEATLVTRLQDAGAIIVAKTTLTELAKLGRHGYAQQLQRHTRLRHEPLRPASGPAWGLQRWPSRTRYRWLEFRHRHRRQPLDG